MKHLKVLGLSLGLVLLTSSPLWADSRSATVRVSCTILPMLEVTTRQMLSQPLHMTTDRFSVSVNTNLGNTYRITESSRVVPAGLLKFISVTAL